MSQPEVLNGQFSPAELGPQYNLSPVNESEAGKISRLALIKSGAAMLGIAVVATACASGDGKGLQRTTAERAPATAGEAADNCANLDFEPVAANSAKYQSEAFLPKAKDVNSAAEAQVYVKQLFGKGPLATKTDVASLAAINALVVAPSHDGEAVDPNYDYSAQWQRSMNEYTSAGGHQTAVEDCTAAYSTMTQTAEYKRNWANPTETITEFQAVRGENNRIIGFKPTKVVLTGNLSGIELAKRPSSKGIDTFTPVLISTTENGGWDGRLFVKGVTKGLGGEVKFDVNAINKANSQENQGESQNKKNNKGGNKNGKNEGVEGTGGAAGPNGQNPEAGPNGVSPSPANGGGNGGGGGETTTTTRPSETTTTTTQPPATTTTTRPPVTTTTTTLPPKDPPSTLPKPPEGF